MAEEPFFGRCKASVSAVRPLVFLMQQLAEANPSTGEPWDVNASMCFRRLKSYTYNVRIPKPNGKIKHCPACFAKFILCHGRPVATTYV